MTESAPPASSRGLAEEAADLVHQAIRSFDHFARKERLAVAVLGVVGFLLPACFGLINGIHEPKIHDEFSFLLAADTYAHGRLTNPTHPLWQHFEAQHILQQPTYMSKYPPAFGMILALGQVLFGHPIAGVWLSCGFASAGLCWMLQAWTRPRWAVFGTCWMIACIGIYGEFSQSYWGGGMFVLAGGALLFGGAIRILAAPHWLASVMMAIGILILANSRPFEGAVAALPTAAVMLVWLVLGRGHPFRVKLTHVLLPVVSLLFVGAAAMAYNNHRVTGEWWTMPYMVHQRKNFTAPLFVFQKSNNQAEVSNRRLRDFYESYSPLEWGWSTYLEGVVDFAVHVIRYLLRYFTWVFLCAVPLLLANRRSLFALGTCLVMFAAVGLATFHASPHYVAPIAPLLYLLAVASFRRARLLQLPPRRRRVPSRHRVWRLKGRYSIAAVLVMFLITLPVAAAVHTRREHAEPLASLDPTTRIVSRHQFRMTLERLPQRHLVFVKYEPGYNKFDDWVFNRAEIDAQQIVWAHDLGRTANQELVEYYGDRTVWQVDVADDGAFLRQQD